MIAPALLLSAFFAGDVAARLRAEPSEVEVGEPCSLILEVEHPPGTTVKLPESDPIPDDSWVLLEPRRTVRGAKTTATWRVLSLEPGERQLPSIRIDLAEAGGVRKIDVEGGMLKVLSALEAGEDAPRPIRGFRAVPQDSVANRGRAVLGGALLLALLAAGLFVWRRRRRKLAPVPVPTALDRLAELEKAVAEDPEHSRRVVYGLSRLLRGSVDEFLREDRAALVDADWAARVEPDERVPLGVRRSIAGVLRDSERIKYAFHAPTRFALEKMFADSRSALEALASAPPPSRAEEAA